ncbi:MAG: hypothetical protein GWO87_01715 [Xanthomonadaceae bacterium]|nr:hypothetical protein [Rhodospirillaceae bacterium]NIA17888.1 hypothetical protein [Xanthomonadaceae bacterium]
MKFEIKNKTGYTTQHLMRSLGYLLFHDAYVRRVGTLRYPRFHIYLKEEDDNIFINLHLDQKKESYQGQKAHSADYNDSFALEKEKQRILNALLKTS